MYNYQKIYKSNPAPSKWITQDTQVGYIPGMLGWFSI